MKTYLALAFAGLAACAAVVHAGATAEQIAEMKDCTVCKVMAEDADLMKEMTWECHKIKDGMLCVATVPKDMKDKYAEIMKKMEATVETLPAKMQQGEDVKLCTFCSGMGELITAGANQETVETATGSICMVTSHDADVVAKIHAQAEKAMAEQEAAAN
jgi:hypothetical protein